MHQHRLRPNDSKWKSDIVETTLLAGRGISEAGLSDERARLTEFGFGEPWMPVLFGNEVLRRCCPVARAQLHHRHRDAGQPIETAELSQAAIFRYLHRGQAEFRLVPGAHHR